MQLVNCFGREPHLMSVIMYPWIKQLIILIPRKRLFCQRFDSLSDLILKRWSPWDLALVERYDEILKWLFAHVGWKYKMFQFQNGSGGRVANGARGLGFESWSRHLDFRDRVSPACKSRYGQKIIKKQTTNSFKCSVQNCFSFMSVCKTQCFGFYRQHSYFTTSPKDWLVLLVTKTVMIQTQEHKTRSRHWNALSHVSHVLTPGCNGN